MPDLSLPDKAREWGGRKDKSELPDLGCCAPTWQPTSDRWLSAQVFNAVGDTLAVITVPESALEPLREDEVCCVRSLG
jgi:hypothetical protein